MTWKNKFTAIQGRAQAAGAVLCKLTPTPGTRSPCGGMHTGSATSLCYGLPAVHVLSSNFGEFPQNHSRETYQIPDMVWLPRAAGTDHIPRSCLYILVESKKSVQLQCPGLHYTSTELPSPVATVPPPPRLVGPWVLGTLWTCGSTSSHHTE